AMGPRPLARGSTVRRNALPRSGRGPPGVQITECAAGATFALRNSCATPPGYLVGETGFEPATPWSRTRCSTRLSHSPKLDSPRGREEVTGRTEPVNPVVAGSAPACRSVLAGASCAAP